MRVAVRVDSKSGRRATWLCTDQLQFRRHHLDRRARCQNHDCEQRRTRTRTSARERRTSTSACQRWRSSASAAHDNCDGRSRPHHGGSLRAAQFDRRRRLEPDDLRPATRDPCRSDDSECAGIHNRRRRRACVGGGHGRIRGECRRRRKLLRQRRRKRRECTGEYVWDLCAEPPAGWIVWRRRRRWSTCAGRGKRRWSAAD
jgi:hypothetical protein